MQGFELATLFVAPSDFQNFCERDPRKLDVVFCALIEVATGLYKNAGIRAGGHFGGPSDFHNFFEVATGPCKNAVNLAGGPFLSSLFSLFSALFPLPS